MISGPAPKGLSFPPHLSLLDMTGRLSKNNNIMKKIPEIRHSWARIYSLLRMDPAGNVLVTAIKQKIFDHLGEPESSDHIARLLNSHPRNTKIFLNALAGVGVIHKKNGQFFNTPESDAFLVSTSPSYLGKFFCRVRYFFTRCRSSEHMESLLINGPENKTGTRDDAEWVAYTRQASAHQFCGPAQRTAKFLASLPEFSGMKKMLDLGGGAGFYAMLTVSAHKTMTGVVFDLPPVVAVAREFIREYGFSDRVSTMGGDYTTDPLGDSYDLVYAGGTLNFAKVHIDTVFRKIYTALNPGGVFISQHGSVSRDRTEPGDQVLDFLFDELNGMDIIFPKGMIANAMNRAGFKSVTSTALKSEFGKADIDIARK